MLAFCASIAGVLCLILYYVENVLNQRRRPRRQSRSEIICSSALYGLPPRILKMQTLIIVDLPNFAHNRRYHGFLRSRLSNCYHKPCAAALTRTHLAGAASKTQGNPCQAPSADQTPDVFPGRAETSIQVHFLQTQLLK